MRKIFMTADGRAVAERMKLNTKLIEEVDGYHLATPDAVWHDDQRKRDPIMIIWHGIINPEGSKVGFLGICRVQNECETIKKARKRQSISKIWARALMRIFGGLMKYGITILAMSLVLYLVYITVTGG